MKPLYIKWISVQEKPRDFEYVPHVVSRFFGPFETKEEAEKYTVPGAIDTGNERIVFCLWPPDSKESGRKK